MEIIKVRGIMASPIIFIPAYIPTHKRLGNVVIEKCTKFNVLLPNNKKIRVSVWGELASRMAKIQTGTTIELEGTIMRYLGTMFELGKNKPIIDWNGEPLLMPKTVVIMTDLIGSSIPKSVRIIKMNK